VDVIRNGCKAILLQLEDNLKISLEEAVEVRTVSSISFQRFAVESM
jgi:hypothetical protein